MAHFSNEKNRERTESNKNYSNGFICAYQYVATGLNPDWAQHTHYAYLVYYSLILYNIIERIVCKIVKKQKEAGIGPY